MLSENFSLKSIPTYKTKQIENKKLGRISGKYLILEILSFSFYSQEALSVLWQSNCLFRDVSIENYKFINSSLSGFLRFPISKFILGKSEKSTILTSSDHSYQFLHLEIWDNFSLSQTLRLLDAVHFC